MRRTNVQPISDILRDFFEDNTEIYEKIIEVSIRRAWEKLLGPVMAEKYTKNIYVRDRILYVYINSAVLRSELLLNKVNVMNSINKEIKRGYLVDLVIR